MATIKVFDSEGCKELKCFDTLVEVPYIEEEEDLSASEDTEAEE